MSYFNGEEVAEEVLIPTELYRQEDGLEGFKSKVFNYICMPNLDDFS